MTAFNQYARYYDLLYRDKDSAAESDYVARHIRSLRPDAVSILELGCGTGRHSFLLAERGFDVTGVDLSQSMIDIAEERKAAQPEAIRSRVEFRQGDIRSLQLNRKYDVMIALFHVISYLNENEDLATSFSNIAASLKPGGLFLFDFWYGPAVLTEKPEPRDKTLEDNCLRVQRLARPEIHYNRNVVDVHYDLAITDKNTRQTQNVHEVHSMRYFFLPEIRQFLQDAEMKFLLSEEWLSGRRPGSDTWGVFCGAEVL